MVKAVKTDYRTAELESPMRALLDYCVRLTQTPWKTEPTDIETLRSHGFDDEAIHDAVQVAAYFAYINRVCDGLGVDLEETMPPKPADWVSRRIGIESTHGLP